MQRGSKSEWRERIARWRRSGQTAAEFAADEGVMATTLRWWAWKLGRGTRAKRERTTGIVPLRIEVEREAGSGGAIEVAVGDAVVRFGAGTDVAYVAELVHALARRS